MNSKNVILLGLLASLLLIFLCVFFNAERYYKELGLSTESSKQVVSSEISSDVDAEEEILSVSDDTIVPLKEEDKVGDITVEEKEETSSFNYYVENNKTFISGEIPLLDNGDVFKEFIANCSKNKLCENNVTFFDNGETLSWKGFVSSMLTIFTEENITNPKLSIDKRDIKIEGEFPSQNGKDQLLTLIKEQKDGYIISDMTTVKKELKEEPKKEESKNEELTSKLSDKPKSSENKLSTNEPSKSKPKKDIHIENIKVDQEKISSILKNNKINFKRNSGKIRKEGRRVLDKIAKLLKDKKDILIEVQGHTDAGGKEKINLWISQVRANGVRKYLIKKGIKADIITAKGFGEKRLLLPKSPYDPSNRRVEIHLKRK